MKTAVTMLGEAFRQWQRDWDNYDNGIGFKPPSYEQFINPYLEKEKEQIIQAHIDGFDHIVVDFKKQEYAEQYYNQTYKPETI
jgi:hypothetical protein